MHELAEECNQVPMSTTMIHLTDRNHRQIHKSRQTIIISIVMLLQLRHRVVDYFFQEIFQNNKTITQVFRLGGNVPPIA